MTKRFCRILQNLFFVMCYLLFGKNISLNCQRVLSRYSVANIRAVCVLFTLSRHASRISSANSVLIGICDRLQYHNSVRYINFTVAVRISVHDITDGRRVRSRGRRCCLGSSGGGCGFYVGSSTVRNYRCSARLFTAVNVASLC